MTFGLVCPIRVSLRGRAVGANRLLILNTPDLNARVQSMLAQMRKEPTLGTIFAKDPAGTIHKFVFPEIQGAHAPELNRGNRLLYAMLLNGDFVAWVQRYEEDLIVEAQKATELDDPAAALRAYLVIIDRGRIHADVAKAIAEFATPELIAALTWTPDPIQIGSQVLPRADVAVEIETFVYAVAVAAVFVVVTLVVGRQAQEDLGDAQVISRADLLEISNQLASKVQASAQEASVAGKLLDFSQRNLGSTR